MNKILVEVSVGELLDKLTILEIKQEKIKDPEKIKYINNEYEVLKDQLNKNIKSNKIEVIYLLGQENEILFNNVKNYFTDLCFKSKTLVENRFSIHEIVKCKK